MLSSKVGFEHRLLWALCPRPVESSVVSNEHDIIIASIREYETSRGVGFECTTNKGSILNDGNGGGTCGANAPEHRHLERLGEEVFDDIISAYDLEQMCTESEEIQRYRAQRRAAGENDALIFEARYGCIGNHTSREGPL